MKQNKVKLLDCTLRDGGYVNDWQFGDKTAQEIVSYIGTTGIDYIELGFIRLGEYTEDIIQFTDMSQVSDLFLPSNQKLAVMVELGYGYPISKFPPKSQNTVDLIRVIIWKRNMREGVEYCRKLRDLGYEVGVQATRTDQYTLEEFKEFVQMYNEINPTALYIVDTFGLLTKDKLLQYARVADENLVSGAMIGYHAHNNMQQAFSNAVAFAEHPWKHEVIIDCSVMGMGRGAGNLPSEIFLKYLNESHNTQYNITPLYEVSQKYLMNIFKEQPWGYSVPYLISATNGCNPNYVSYLQSKELSIPQIDKVLREMHCQGKGIVYSEEECERIIEQLFPNS